MKSAKSLLLILVGGLASLALAADEGGSGAGAKAAFEKLKSLEGRWEATTPKGKKAMATYELVSANSAVLERYLEEGADYGNMITMYHLDGDRLLLTHYCAAKNQPRMRAESFAAAEGVLTFSFLNATNLASPDQGHMHRAVFKFEDSDHFTTEWTWRENQKDKFTEVLRFERKR